MVQKTLALGLFGFILSSCTGAPQHTEVVSASSDGQRASASVRHDVVETYDPIENEIGYSILAQGGNAFDAFVAATFADYVLAAGITSPAGPLGVLVYDSKAKKVEYLDAGFNDPLDPKHKWETENPKAGASALVPGAIAGLEALSKKYGKLSFEKVLEPAIHLAENGFPLNQHYVDLISAYSYKLKRTPYGRETFFKNDRPLEKETVLKLPVLALFLKKLAAQGSSYAYTGDWARACLEEVNAAGGHLLAQDFKSYRVEWENVLSVPYRGLDLFFPKTYGAMISSMALKVLERYDLKKFGAHYTSSAEGIALVDRAYIESSSEPWLFDQKKMIDENFLNKMLGPRHIDEIRERIDKKLTASPAPDKGTHSHQVTIIDHDGNAVTGTNTIEGLPWGDGLFVEGVPLSSSGQLHAFSTAPGQRRRLGLSMHIGIKQEKIKFASGAFNSSLIPAEFQFILNLIDYQLPPREAMTAPRIGTQAWDFATTKRISGQWLDPRISSTIVEKLEKDGLKFTQVAPVDTGLGAVAIAHDDGSVDGAIAPISPVEKTKAVGIGASLGVDDNHRVFIFKVAPNSPAAKAGVESSDIIVSVQNTPDVPAISTENKSPAEVIALIRGPKGTPLILKILKKTGQTKSVQLIRDEYSF
jgi:gamma-glutamyltranspeptidase / glutathione hydrolase